MTDPTNPPVDAPSSSGISSAMSSELATDMVNAGAAPVDVNVDELQARIKAMEERMASLLAAQGVPADPVAANVKDLRDHIRARVAAIPGRLAEFSELLDAAEKLSDNPSAADTDMIRTLLDDREGAHWEGEDYIRRLATALHKLVLKG